MRIDIEEFTTWSPRGYPMELFHREKERVLRGKDDLSRKGSVDQPIIGLVDHINSLDQYYTTSSCSGRIIVFSEVRQFKLSGGGLS